MDGIPEAVGTGVTKLVDINPAIGLLVGILLIAIAWQTREAGLARKREQDAVSKHLAYVETQIDEAREDRKIYDRFIDELDKRAARK